MQTAVLSRANSLDTSLVEMDAREFNLFRSLVHKHCGIWLKDGKRVMLASRLSRRLRHHGLRSYSDYYDYVQAHLNDTDELRELTNCVTTNKTSFFRERHHFDFLTSTLIPQVLGQSAPGAHEPIRIWSAACSTGEEPYTLAITLLEALASRRRPGSAPPLSCAPAGYGAQIIASDIDTQVLGKAARGVYREESLESVDLPLRKKYFLKGTGEMAGYVRVKPELIRMVEFVNLNLMTPQWPMTGPFDAIFFRNALIYFQKETQDILLRKMARLLKPGGYLFLGNSEHIAWLNDIYEPMKQTMYRLRDTAR